MTRYLGCIVGIWLFTVALHCYAEEPQQWPLMLLQEEELSHMLKNEPPINVSKGQTVACSYDTHPDPFVCTSQKCAKRKYFSPFPVYSPEGSTCRTETLPIVQWLPAKYIRDGSKIVEHYRTRQMSAPVYCSEHGCDILFRTNSVTLAGVRYEGLARCRSTRYADALGAPESCSIVLVFTENDFFLPALIAFEPLRNWGGAIPAFRIEVHMDSDADFLAWRKSIATALEEKPLSLSADPKTTVAPTIGIPVDIVGIAGPRPSTTASGWEWIQVRVEGNAMPSIAGELPKRAEFLITFSLWINPRNTEALKEWRMPEATRHKNYATRLKVAVGSALESICDRPAWLNSEVLQCSTSKGMSNEK